MTRDSLQRENEELRRQLAEAEEALAAIREGQVDAIVTEGAGGPRVFSLSGVETIYRLAVETMAEAAIYTTVEGTILFCNSRFTEFVAMPMEHVLGREITDFVPAEDRESLRALLEECVRRPVKKRVVFRGAEGVRTPVMLTGVAQSQDGVATLCLVAADRTEPERQLENLQRVNRLYAVLSRVNEAILRVREEKELFHAACRIAVEDGGFVLAWIGFVDSDTQRVRVAARYGRDEGYLDDILISTDASLPEGQGPIAVALRECRPVIDNDTAHNALMTPWRDVQLALGFEASASFPLTVDGDCIGVVTLYADAPGVFDEEEVRLLTALADDFSFALQAGRQERERLDAVAALQRSRDELEVRVEERTAEIQSLYEEQSSMTEELQSQTDELSSSLEKQARLSEQLSAAKHDVERELETTRLLLDAADTLSASIDPDRVVRSLVELVRKATDRGRVTVSLYDGDSDEAVVISPDYQDALPPGTRVAIDALAPATRRAIEERQVQIVDYESPAMRPLNRQRAEVVGHRLIAIVPIVHGERVIGFFNIDEPGKRREFTNREIEIAQAIAAQAGVALDNARLHQTTELELTRTRLLQDVALAAGTGPDLQAVATRILDSLKAHLQLKGGDLRVRDGDRLRLLAAFNYPAESIDLLRDVFMPTSPLLGVQAVLEDRTLTHESETLTPERRVILERQGILDDRYVYVPVRYRDEVLGMLSLTFAGRRPFADRELDLFSSVASVAGQALANARLYEREQQELETTTQLLNAAKAFAGASSLSCVLDQVAGSVLAATGRKRILISLWDAERRQLVLAASAGDYEASVGIRYEWDDLAEPTKVALSERRVLIADYDQSESDGARYIGPPDMRMALVVPLADRDVLTGLMVVDDPGERHAFSERELAVVEGIAAQAETAIQNARLLDEERERTRFGVSMAEISTHLSSSLDIEQTLTVVLDTVCHEMAACGVAVSDRIGGGWRIRRRAGLEGPVLDEGFVLDEDQMPMLTEAVRTRTPVVVNDVRATGDATRDLADKAGFKSCFVYPLVVRDEVRGVLTVLFPEPKHLSEIESDYLRRVAFAISVSEENSRLYKAEHDIADRLQGALLALPDEIPGVEFAHAYHSASEVARVGGDFYDIFELKHDLVGIMVGDVAGKGLDAAVLTSMVKNTIRAHANERGKTPAQILGLTNDVIYRQTSTEAFLTVFFGILDCTDGRLVYSNAGHTTSVVVGADGSVGKLSVTGPLLGAFEGASFAQAETLLDPEQLLLLYTDGLTEARRDGELYGEERLVEFLSSTRVGSVEAVVQAVIDDVISFSRDRLRDDLAIIAVKRARRPRRPSSR